MKGVRAQTSLEPSPCILIGRPPATRRDETSRTDRIAKAGRSHQFPPHPLVAPVRRVSRRAAGIHGGGGARRLEGHQGEGTHQLHPRRPRRRILVTPHSRQYLLPAQIRCPPFRLRSRSRSLLSSLALYYRYRLLAASIFCLLRI